VPNGFNDPLGLFDEEEEEEEELTPELAKEFGFSIEQAEEIIARRKEVDIEDDDDFPGFREALFQEKEHNDEQEYEAVVESVAEETGFSFSEVAEELQKGNFDFDIKDEKEPTEIKKGSGPGEIKLYKGDKLIRKITIPPVPAKPEEQSFLDRLDFDPLGLFTTAEAQAGEVPRLQPAHKPFEPIPLQLEEPTEDEKVTGKQLDVLQKAGPPGELGLPPGARREDYILEGRRIEIPDIPIQIELRDDPLDLKGELEQAPDVPLETTKQTRIDILRPAHEPVYVPPLPGTPELRKEEPIPELREIPPTLQEITAEQLDRLKAAASGASQQFVKGITLGYVDLFKTFPEMKELDQKFSENILINEDDPLMDKIVKGFRNDPAILAKIPARLLGEMLTIGKISRAVTSVMGVPGTILEAIKEAGVTGILVGGIRNPESEAEGIVEELGQRASNAITTGVFFAGTTGLLLGADRLFKTKPQVVEDFKETAYKVFIDKRGFPRNDTTIGMVDDVIERTIQDSGGLGNIKKSTFVKAIKVAKQLIKDKGGFVRTKGGAIDKVAIRPEDPGVRQGFKFKNQAFEQRFKAAKGVPVKSTLQKAKDIFASAKRKVSREFEHIPKTKEFAQLRFDLLSLSKQKGVSSDKAIRAMGDITGELSQREYDLFTRKVVMDDLANEAAGDRLLPFGLTSESLQQELPALNAAVSQNPNVQNALAKRQEITNAIKDDYIASMEDIGFNVGDRLSKENYFRHQVLEHMNNRALYGTGAKLKTPAGRGFLKQRLGSESDINTDYLQAEHEVLAQMIHDIEVGKTIKSINDKYNISDQVRAEAKEKGIEDWHDAIPEGYVTWQPREGNLFFMANSIPENIAEELFNSELKEIGITKDDIKRIMAVGRQRSEFVVKEEVADTLDALQIPQSQNVIVQGGKEITKKWKIWVLGSPRRTVKYNIRNMTGDADAMFVGNTSAFKKTPRATKELWQLYFGHGEMTSEMQDWFDRGGMQSTMQVQEIGDINRLSKFRNIRDPQANPDNLPVKVWKAYWNNTRRFTDFRESILRYSAYLDYSEQIQNSPTATPNNYGASIPQEIDGLLDSKDKAFFLSNDLLGAYDRISVFGQAMRESVAPFWSWKELNFRRYKQMAKNSANDGKVAEAVGRKAVGTLAKSPFVAARVGKFLIKASAFWAVFQVWNHSMFPEEEASLPEREQARPHIIFGKDKDGNVFSFNRIGALGDFLEWFGLDAAPKHVNDWFKGKRTLKEIARDMAQSGPNILANSITPLVKIPAEVASRQSFFPNVFEPRTIRDRGLHVAGGLGLRDEYIAAFGLPSRGYAKSLTQVLIYKTNPEQAAYSHISGEKFRFLKNIGKYGEGFWLTPRGDALYQYKLSLKFKDKEAADKYLREYVALGGTQKGLNSSIKRMHPLGGLSQKDRESFKNSLNKNDQGKLALAIQFYEETIKGLSTPISGVELPEKQQTSIPALPTVAIKYGKLIPDEAINNTKEYYAIRRGKSGPEIKNANSTIKFLMDGLRMIAQDKKLTEEDKQKKIRNIYLSIGGEAARVTKLLKGKP